jgi:hypothetical protein
LVLREIRAEHILASMSVLRGLEIVLDRLLAATPNAAPADTA